MPFPDASFDAITCVYLLHELPPETRREVAKEAAAERGVLVEDRGEFLSVDAVVLVHVHLHEEREHLGLELGLLRAPEQLQRTCFANKGKNA